jgi:choline dehydrogenase-like flavoprotein
VTISEKSDDYGRIIPIVKWCPTSNDFIVFNKLQNLLCSAFTKSSYNFKPNSILNTSIYSGCHFAGTARIGESRKSSVVDIDLKVHDTNNLYVCDLSIFPNFGNSNPTYTLFAFADRLAIKLARI